MNDHGGLCLIHLVSQHHAMRALMAVEVRDVNSDIDEVSAHLVHLHVDRARVAGNVDFREDVEEVRFGHTAVVDQGVHQVLHRVKMWNQLLDDPAECLKDGVVVDRGQVISDIWVDIARVMQVISNTLRNVLANFSSELIIQAVDLVDEDFDVDVREGVLKIHDSGSETIQGLAVFVLCIYDPDECTNLGEYLIRVKGWIEVVDLTRKVPDLEIHE